MSIVIVCFPGAPQVSQEALQREAELERQIDMKVEGEPLIKKTQLKTLKLPIALLFVTVLVCNVVFRQSPGHRNYWDDEVQKWGPWPFVRTQIPGCGRDTRAATRGRYHQQVSPATFLLFFFYRLKNTNYFWHNATCFALCRRDCIISSYQKHIMAVKSQEAMVRHESRDFTFHQMKAIKTTSAIISK